MTTSVMSEEEWRDMRRMARELHDEFRRLGWEEGE